ncbi:MAG: hypothetical protein E7316_08690 [Clostridiales bacterium]|nr:hypothetical protein [Clostridiales bacterium]
MRLIHVNNPIEYNQLRREYLDYRRIMSRYGVCRATAYRYMSKVPPELTIRVQMLTGKPCKLCQLAALDRIHARALPGNPNLRK